MGPDLDDRKALILRAIVSHYVSTGEPVGSKTLVDRYRLRVSPATVRNDMGALEDHGYIYQPHTSAGRIPTDTGYRFYVDSETPGRLPSAHLQQIRSFFDQPRFEFEESLRQTASLLSRLTDHAAVVFAPALDRSVVRHVELVRLGTGRAMLVLVTDTGRVENHVVAVGDLTDDELDDASASLNALVVDTHLDDAARTIEGSLDRFAENMRGPIRGVAETLAADLQNRDAERVYLEGTSNIVDEHKFADLETVRQVIGALEHRRVVLEVMADALRAADVSVRIGSENPVEEMQSCTVIAAPYGTEHNILGTVGVVGPTRMDYRSTIPAVYEVSAQLGRMLTDLGM